MRTAVKTVLLGRPGPRPRRIRRGLGRGLIFNIDTSSKSQRLLGLDEREITAPLRQLAAGATVALDIGANDGWYALYFASRDNMQKVYAFEPDSQLQRMMKENFALNDPRWAAKTTFVQKFVGNRDADNWCRVDTLKLDASQPTLLKIDVDGGETEVLRGARETLKSGRCTLVVETHSPELEAQCLELLKGDGYECRIINNAWYRCLIPEARNLPHNRWLVARRD